MEKKMRELCNKMQRGQTWATCVTITWSTRPNPRPAARPAITASQPADRDVKLDPSPIARSIKKLFYFFMRHHSISEVRQCLNLTWVFSLSIRVKSIFIVQERTHRYTILTGKIVLLSYFADRFMTSNVLRSGAKMCSSRFWTWKKT